jgi:UDP-glucose 4-epimerase
MSYTIPKLIDELKLNILKKEGLRSSSLRFFNVIGPNQTARYGMVVPRFIKQALAGKPLTIYGDGSQIRTFCDIRDIVASINHLIDDENTGYEIYNIGGKKEISINQLANIILSLTKSKSKKVYIPYSQVHEDYEEIYYRKPSITKIKKRYGWTPIYSIEDSIRSIIEHNHNDVIKI